MVFIEATVSILQRFQAAYLLAVQFSMVP
jgi:hypothetical protein